MLGGEKKTFLFPLQKFLILYLGNYYVFGNYLYWLPIDLTVF